MDIKEIDILGNNVSQHWYYRSKAKAMTKLLGKTQPSSVLDVGAGSGFFSRHLLSNSEASEAWCIDTSYRNDSDGFEAGKRIHFRRQIDHVDADLVLLMDVLEHIDDDVRFLQTCIEKVPKSAKFLISVPAFKCLWSSHDVFLEHKRRYTLNQIEDVAHRAGLTVLCGTYYFGAVFPIAAIARLFERITKNHSTPARSQLTQHSLPVNKALSILCGLELPLMKFNRMAGLSALCFAEKR